MKRLPVAKSLLLIASIALPLSVARAHCQIPCGIYDDEVRFTTMLEHVTTIEKSMKQIVSLSKAKSPAWNQLVRWVQNKDEHADRLAHIATYYFMAQRVKPPQEGVEASVTAKYERQIGLLHRIVVHAMKAKQTTDLDHVNALRELIESFGKSYLGEGS